MERQFLLHDEGPEKEYGGTPMDDYSQQMGETILTAWWGTREGIWFQHWMTLSADGGTFLLHDEGPEKEYGFNTGWHSQQMGETILTAWWGTREGIWWTPMDDYSQQMVETILYCMVRDQRRNMVDTNGWLLSADGRDHSYSIMHDQEGNFVATILSALFWTRIKIGLRPWIKLSAFFIFRSVQLHYNV
jgi:hypothetical protein